MRIRLASMHGQPLIDRLPQTLTTAKGSGVFFGFMTQRIGDALPEKDSRPSERHSATRGWDRLFFRLQVAGAVTDCGFGLVGGRGWTELAKKAPGIHSFLAPTPATLFNFTIIRYCTRRWS